MRGISSLGLCHPRYQVRHLIACFDNLETLCFGWLDKFFNAHGSRGAIKVMMVPKPKVVRVHIINGPGLNNRRVQPHEISYGYTHDGLVRAIKKGDERFLRKYRRRCGHIRDVASYAPGDTLKRLYLSPWLEHGPLPKSVMDTLAQIAIEELGPYTPVIVDSPLKGAAAPGYLVERHNKASSAADIVDLDGKDYRDGVNLEAYYDDSRQAKMVLIWSTNDNGLDRDEPWKSPDRRVNWTHMGKWSRYKTWLERGR